MLFFIKKKNLICFYIIAVFYNKIKNHLWNPRSNIKVNIPRTNEMHEHVFSKGPFLYQLFNEQGGKKQTINQTKIILSLLFLASTNSPHIPRRQILSINISVSSEVLALQEGRRSSSSCVQCLRGPVLPRGSVQGDDVGRAAAAGDDAGLGPARGANVCAALVVAGGGDDAARRAAC